MITMANKPDFTPIYKQVKNYLKEQIIRGSFKDMDKLPSEPELALSFGVNRQTIRKATAQLCQEGLLAVVKGRGTFIIDSEKSKMLQKKNIGLIYPFDIDEKYIGSNYYFGTIMGEVINSTNYNTFKVIPLIMRNDTFLDIYNSNSLNGMIIVAPREEHWDELKKLSETNIPFVVLGGSFKEGKINYIASDNIGAMHMIMDYLVELGHERIGFLGELDGVQDHRDRLYEYKNSLKRYDLPIKDEYIVLRQLDKDFDRLGYEGAKKLINLRARPTAIFCLNSNTLIEAMHSIKEEGLKIPEDISLIGFDDPEIMRHAEPPVTVIRQPLEEMCRAAVGEIQRRTMSHITKPVQVRIKVELIERQSCVSPRK